MQKRSCDSFEGTAQVKCGEKWFVNYTQNRGHIFSKQAFLRQLWDKVNGFMCFSFTAHKWRSLSKMLFVHLAETSALPGSRSGAGPAPCSAAGVTQERKGTTFVKAYSSGVCDGWPEGRKENLGTGARSARWETGWGGMNQGYTI